MATKATKKPKPKPEPEPEPVVMRATTAILHDGRKVAAGTRVDSDDPIVARFPNLFEVDG